MWSLLTVFSQSLIKTWFDPWLHCDNWPKIWVKKYNILSTEIICPWTGILDNWHCLNFHDLKHSFWMFYLKWNWNCFNNNLFNRGLGDWLWCDCCCRRLIRSEESSQRVPKTWFWFGMGMRDYDCVSVAHDCCRFDFLLTHPVSI